MPDSAGSRRSARTSEPSAIACRRCGTRIAGNALICYRCGTAVDDLPSVPARPPTRRVWLPVVVAIVIVALAVALIWLGLTPEG